MKKSEAIRRIVDTGFVAIVRAGSADDALRTAEACLEGGVRVLEVTFTVPGAQSVIAELTRRETGLLIGAGTVLDTETARIAHLEGAGFLVGPSLDRGVSRLANRYGIPYIPGVGTVGEVVRAMECGAEIVKVFPGGSLGPGFVRAVLGPLPHASLMPTGGVSADNVAEWFRAGAVAVGSGGRLTKGAETGDYAAVAAEARRFIDAIRDARR